MCVKNQVSSVEISVNVSYRIIMHLKPQHHFVSIVMVTLKGILYKVQEMIPAEDESSSV